MPPVPHGRDSFLFAKWNKLSGFSELFGEAILLSVPVCISISLRIL